MRRFSRSRHGRRLRVGHRNGPPQYPVEPGVSLPIGSPAVRAWPPNTPYRLNDIDLASRLSFFIWSSIPDDTLLNLAAKGTLHQPQVIEQQVTRMLADPKSQALVRNFAGQWLQVRNVQTHQPSPETLFHFDDNLRKAPREEMNLVFANIIRENRPVTDLLDANYTFLNERLAKTLWDSRNHR